MISRGVAVVPLKAPRWAKSRLIDLSPTERVELVGELASHVIATLAAIPAIAEVVVVAQDAEAAALAQRAGARAVLEDPADGGRLGAIVDRTLALLSTPWALVVMADLPHLTAADILALVAGLTDHDAVIAPDRQSTGTNALALRLPAAWPTALGRVDSFAEHQIRAGGRAAIVRSPTLAFDVDTPSDLVAFRAAIPGFASRAGRHA